MLPAAEIAAENIEVLSAANWIAGLPSHHHAQKHTEAPSLPHSDRPGQVKAYDQVLPSKAMPEQQTTQPLSLSNELTIDRLQPVRRLYLKAQQYHRQNRIADAVALYREVLKLKPNLLDAQINLASALIQQQDYASACRLALDTIKLAPHNDRAHLNLAIAEIGKGEPAKALVRLDQAEKLHAGPWFEVFLHRGVAFSHLSQLDKARQSYERARQLSPKDPQVLFNLAIINDKSEHYQIAARYYQDYLSVHDNILPDEKKRIGHRLRILKAYLASSAKSSSNLQ
jgi:tetratricopeptide (TPR) repeat protein